MSIATIRQLMMSPSHTGVVLVLFLLDAINASDRLIVTDAQLKPIVVDSSTLWPLVRSASGSVTYSLVPYSTRGLASTVQMLAMQTCLLVPVLLMSRISGL